MTDPTGATPADVDPATGDDEEAQNLLADAVDDSDDPDSSDPEGADQLGDAGKKALDAMKAKYKAERDKRKTAEAELAKRDEPKPGAEKDEPDLDQVRAEAARTATAKANARIIRSEIRAAAAGKLADPKDALTFLDIEQFEVDENGDVDAEEITEAIDDLLKNKPYLSAATAKRFQGTGDGGAARKAGKPKQLSRDDLKRMSPEQIEKARTEGRLDDLLAGKQKG